MQLHSNSRGLGACASRDEWTGHPQPLYHRRQLSSVLHCVFLRQKQQCLVSVGIAKHNQTHRHTPPLWQKADSDTSTQQTTRDISDIRDR